MRKRHLVQWCGISKVWHELGVGRERYLLFGGEQEQDVSEVSLSDCMCTVCKGRDEEALLS